MQKPNKNQKHNIMKRLSLVVIGVGCLVFQAQAQLFQEGFNYTSGANLAGNGPWTGGNANISIGSANLTYPGLSNLGGNDLSLVAGASASTSAANFTATAITSGTVYYSFLLESTALPTANSYLTSLLNTGSAGPSGSADPLAVYVGTTAGGFKIGVRHTGVGSGATYASGTYGTVGSVDLIVVGYTFGGGGSESLWINPTPGGSMPAANVTVAAGGTEATGLQVVGFKSNSTGAAAGTWLFDNLLIGTSWADVTPIAVPEPSTFALAGLGMLGLVFARRMRR